MGQIEVYQWLNKMRLTGNHEYFKISEIHRGMKRDGFSCSQPGVWGNVIKMEGQGYLEVKMTGKYDKWHRNFRLKEEFVNSNET